MVNALIIATVSTRHHRERSANVPQVVSPSRGSYLPYWMAYICVPKTPLIAFVGATYQIYIDTTAPVL